MSDDKIIAQGEDAIIYVLSVRLRLDACEEKRINRFKKEILKNYPGWNEKTKTAILNGEVFIGMTKKQVRVSWGDPKRTVKTITDNTLHERFLYGNSRDLSFEGDILTAVQVQK